jgi:hypothetical protein
MPSNVPREYCLTVTATSLGGDGGAARFGVVFPFDATCIFVAHDGSTGTMYVSLTSSAGSTGGWPVKPSESFTITDLKTYCLGVASTTTSTVESFRLGAWA